MLLCSVAFQPTVFCLFACLFVFFLLSFCLCLQPPYVMDRWRTSTTGSAPVVECTVNYEVRVTISYNYVEGKDVYLEDLAGGR